MDKNRRGDLEKGQRRDEIMAISDLISLLLGLTSYPKLELSSCKLQGFGAVHIVGLNLDRAQVQDLAIFVTHVDFYTKVFIWLKTNDGARSWTTVIHQHTRY